MKLRRHAEDFEVLERSSLPLGQSGPYAVYELQKKGWTTLDVIEKLSREFGLPRKNIDHAGLKDRHAITVQSITIKNGPRRSYHDGSWTLSYVGQAPRAIRAQDIIENRFAIVLRSLSATEHANAEVALKEIQQAGVPNYFDDQRFGSWFPEKGFIATSWIRGDYETAFYLAFAEHEPTDSPEEREQKAILRENWGNWIECKRLLDRSHRRSIVTYLCDHPTNFKGAWATVNSDLRGLYLSALQSDLWNQIASRHFQQACSAEQLTPMSLKTGIVWCPRELPAEQLDAMQKTEIPLPSGRLQHEDFPNPELVEQVLAEQGWQLPELKVKFPRDRFFSRAQRSLMVPVRNLTGEFGEDEYDSGRTKLSLRFALGRGSYATMIVKRLFLGSAVGLDDAEEGSESHTSHEPVTDAE